MIVRLYILSFTAFLMLVTACKKELPRDRHDLKYAPYDINLVPLEIVDRMQQLVKDHPEFKAKGIFYYKSGNGDGKYILLLSVLPPEGSYMSPSNDQLPAFSDLYTDYIVDLISSKVLLNNSLSVYNCSKVEIYMVFPDGGDIYISYY